MSEDRSTLVVARELAASTSDPRLAVVLNEICDELEVLLENRATIGFDLHDGPLQSLAAVRLDVELFRSQVEAPAGEVPVLGRIADIGARLSSLEVELRDLAVASAQKGSAATLTALITDAADEAAGDLSVDLRLDPELDQLAVSDRQQLALARVVSAAVANAAQHSGARLVVVAVRVQAGFVVVDVADAGTGFDVAGARGEGRLGLLGMSERMRRLGGELQVESVPGAGTAVRARLPVH